MNIKSYSKIEKLNVTLHSDFCTAYDKNNEKVILKSIKNNLHINSEKLHNEYSLLNNCKHENIIKVKALETVENKTFLIREYFDGITLKSFLEEKNSLPLNLFLDVSIVLCNALYNLHLKNIIHGNITADSILINKDFVVKLTGFGFASTRMENGSLFDGLNENINNVYHSPEQTGRIDNIVTCSTDIYSLGMVFYYLLTGKSLYEGANDSSLSYSIVTKGLKSVHLINSTIPKVLSLIIDKMINKDKKNRYSNILSVIMDLIKVRKNNSIDFKLDTLQDILEFNHLNTLFGREEEYELFNNYLTKLNSNKSCFISILGDSGIGKSTFINHVLKEKKDNFSYIVRIKLDEFKQNSSYEILYIALRNLTKQIITTDRRKIEKWKNKIENELKEKVVLLFSIIPELQYIVGRKESCDIILDNDYKAQLDAVLIRFLQLFSKDEKPLCIYIDDVQWADHVTLKWIESVVINLKNVLVITSHREDEVNDSDPFYILLKKLNSIDISIDSLKIEPMNQESIKNFISSAIELEQIDEISSIIFNKTRGNSLFVKQYIKELQIKNAIYFDSNKLKWFSNLEKIGSMRISDNVFDMLSNQIKDFSSNIQYLLNIASCIGNEFSKEILEKIYNDKFTFQDTLDSAIQKEWLIYLHTDYKIDSVCCFSHDRMKEVVYTSINEAEKATIHLKIAQTLYADLNKDNLILCVNSFNLALLKIPKNEISNISNLNLEAAYYSKKNGDFVNALHYVKTAMDIILNFEVEKNFIEVLKLRAECEHLCHNNKEAIHYYELALSKSQTIEEKGLIYELLINFYTDCTQFKEAYEIGRKATRLFGMSLPKEFNKFIFIKNFLSLKYKLRSYTIENILEIEVAKDEEIKLFIRILSALLKVSYQIRPELSVEISMKLINLCLKKGITSESVVGFMVFGVIFQGGVLSNHNIGYEYSKLCFKMLEKFNNTTQHSEVQFVCGYFATSWKNPASYTEKLWQKSYENGLEIGDWFHLSCSAVGIVQSMFMRGESLDNILEKIDYFEVMLKSIGMSEQLGAILSVKYAILNLKEETNSILSFSTNTFDEESYVKTLEEYNSPHFALNYFLNKMITLYFHKKYEEALKISNDGKKFTHFAKGMLHNTEYEFYRALIYAKLINKSNFLKRTLLLREIISIKNKFKFWAKSSPENFLARQKILESEIYRIRNNFASSIKCFDEALEITTIYGQNNLKVIIYNIISKMYKNKSQKKVFLLYESSIKVSSSKWIYNKVIKINDCFNKKNDENLNLQTLTKSAEIIVKEHNLEELLKKLIQLIINNASAQSGALLLKHDDDFLIQAQSSVDKEDIYVLQAQKFENSNSIVKSVVNYVINSNETLVLDNLQENTIFNKDSDVLNRGVKSVLCAPLKLLGELKGIIYLENNLISGVFTYEKVELLKHLSGQIAISIENAQIYNKLEEKVEERTRDLDYKNEKLESQNRTLQKQNDEIFQLNKEVLKENEERKKVESKLQKAIEKLDLLATTDSLTTLNNRRSFDQYLKRTFVQAKRDNTIFSLMICDVDFFKKYNDFYGHQEGDKCLIKVAKVLNDSIKRPSDFVSRYGGEEFAIILPDTNRAGAIKISDEIHNELKSSKIFHQDSDVSKYITISIGIVTSSEIENCDIEELIHTADIALYKAKELGRNQTV